MSDNITPNGGPAFPQHGWTSNPEVLARMQQNSGMTLRDFFAGQAMQALAKGHYDRNQRWHDLATDAYEIADAMLAIREGGGQ